MEETVATWGKIRNFSGVRSSGSTTPLGGNDPALRKIRRDIEANVRTNGVQPRGGASRDAGLSAQQIRQRRNTP